MVPLLLLSTSLHRSRGGRLRGSGFLLTPSHRLQVLKERLGKVDSLLFVYERFSVVRVQWFVLTGLIMGSTLDT